MTESQAVLDSNPPPVPSSGPTLGKSRIDSIDVLRGFALMGILIMNIQSFSMPEHAYLDPSFYGDLNGANAVVWFLGYVFVDMKFMAMFSMLFGAGIVLMSQHRDAANKPVAALHYRRMLLLLAFGLIHAYFIWYGDILVSYAICGMVVFWFRRWSPRTQVFTGAILVTLGSAIYTLGGIQTGLSEEAADFYRTEMVPSAEATEDELATYRGSDWTEQLKHRATSAAGFHFFVLPLIFFWRICGLMLIGMALFKWGVLSARRTNRFYATMAIIGGGVGVPLTTLGAIWAWSRDFDSPHLFGFGSLPNWFGSVPVALMWIALIMLFVRSPILDGLKDVLGAYGRMAFTNYIGQSVMATAIFYGYGLGWFGSVERIGQVGVVVAIWAIQLAIAPIWLRYFKFGPLEWVWRSAAYKKRQPMLREA